MTELPEEPANLKFLRRLVTVLTATMILGVGTIVVLLFMRLSQSAPSLPEQISLPEGASAVAVTAAADWYAVVTTQNEILVFDKTTGQLRQTVRVTGP